MYIDFAALGETLMWFVLIALTHILGYTL